MTAPVVTIITVTRNNLAGLQATRASVLALQNVSYEHLIVDGASTDQTVPYLQTNFKPGDWTSHPDAGPYDAMNQGATRAQGKYVLFLNAGDTLIHEHFSQLIQAAELGHADIVYGDHIFNKKIRRATEVRILHEELLKGNARFWLTRHPCHQATLIRTDIIKKQPYDLTYHIAADFNWLEKLRAQGARILYQPGVICRYQPGGLSNQKLPRCLAEWYRIIHHQCQGENPLARNYLSKLLARHLRRKARQRCKQRFWPL